MTYSEFYMLKVVLKNNSEVFLDIETEGREVEFESAVSTLDRGGILRGTRGGVPVAIPCKNILYITQDYYVEDGSMDPYADI